MSSGRSFKELQKLREAFDLFDLDKDGLIDIEELRKLINKIQKRAISLAEVETFMEKVEVNGKISFKELCELLPLIIPNDPDAELKRAFDEVDIDQCGSLDFVEFVVLLEELGFEVSEDEKKKFASLDFNERSSIDFEEFKSVYIILQDFTVVEIKQKRKEIKCCYLS